VDKDIIEPQLVPDMQNLKSKYSYAYDIPNEIHIELAAIRQIFVDQSQSQSLFYSDKNNKASAKQHLKDMILAHKLGLKTLYYANTLDETVQQDCEWCGS